MDSKLEFLIEIPMNLIVETSTLSIYNSIGKELERRHKEGWRLLDLKVLYDTYQLLWTKNTLTNLQLIKLLREQTKIHNANN